MGKNILLLSFLVSQILMKFLHGDWMIWVNQHISKTFQCINDKIVLKQGDTSKYSQWAIVITFEFYLFCIR